MNAAMIFWLAWLLGFANGMVFTLLVLRKSRRACAAERIDVFKVKR